MNDSALLEDHVDTPQQPGISTFSRLSGPSEPDPATRFRALKVRNRRRGFALEAEFWAILEEAAKESALGLGEYVATITDETVAANQSSMLRRKAAQWLLRSREQTRRQDPKFSAQRIIAATPCPALVLNDRRTIVAYNRCFLGLRLQTGSASAVHLHLEMSVPLLF